MGAEGRESESEPAGSGEMEEEEMDSITEVPANCSVLRSSMRSLSPFRRHSWGPGKNAASDAEMNHRSSMRVLGDVVRRPPIHRRSFSLEGLTGGAGNKPSSSLDINPSNTKELRHPLVARKGVTLWCHFQKRIWNQARENIECLISRRVTDLNNRDLITVHQPFLLH